MTTLQDDLIDSHDTTMDAAGKLVTYNGYTETCVDAKGTIHVGVGMARSARC